MLLISTLKGFDTYFSCLLTSAHHLPFKFVQETTLLVLLNIRYRPPEIKQNQS